MTQHPKQWLSTVPWDSVVNLNRALCQSQKLEPLTDAEGLAAARRLWEKSVPQSLLLRDALKVCHDACELAPFVFNNGNTFASIGRALVEEQLKAAPAVEAQVLRTTIGHYVAGQCRRRELHQVLDELGSLLSLPANVPPPAPAPIIVTMPREQRV